MDVRIELSDKDLSDEAESFSAYAIVDGITEESTETWGWQKIASLDEFASHTDSGLIVGHSDGFYFTDETYIVKGTRTGIKKTEKPGQDFPRDTAKPYFFEEDPANAGCYFAYCVKNGENWYVMQSTNSLSLVNSRSNASSFVINCEADSVFTVKARNNAYYWNQQGDANGNGFVLPATGGPGTRRLIFFGAAMAAGAGLILWRRRRTLAG